MERRRENGEVERTRGRAKGAIVVRRRNICALNYFTDLVDRYGL